MMQNCESNYTGNLSNGACMYVSKRLRQFWSKNGMKFTKEVEGNVTFTNLSSFLLVHQFVPYIFLPPTLTTHVLPLQYLGVISMIIVSIRTVNTSHDHFASIGIIKVCYPGHIMKLVHGRAIADSVDIGHQQPHRPGLAVYYTFY